ncbi:MAG: sulfurtransferase TusA family protein [Thermoplasmata archaeon]|nr:sulfurtransferase TusA family protein [Thermoplasmata archaeon]
MEVKKVVDVRGLNPKERQKIVMEESKKLETGEIIEVISDDERMPKFAPKIAEAMGNIEFINVKKENGLY